LVDKRGITYGVVQPGHPVENGTPVLRVTNFSGGRLRLHEVLRVDPSITDRYERSRLVGGEVLITLVGSVGQVAVAPPDVAGWNVARAVGVIPVRRSDSAAWVAACLRSPDVRARLAARFNTTVQTTLNLKDLGACELAIPPVRERDEIIRVLSALDDKIESNRRLADAVDDVCLMAFEDAERGAVETLALEDFVAFNQLSWSARRHPAEIDYLDISSLQPRRVTTIQRVGWSDAPSRARRVVRSGDTIISTVRPERRALAFVDAASAELTASTGFAVLTPISVSPTYAYFAATSERATNFFAGAATGSAYPAVRVDAMKTFAIRVPADRGEQFEELARPLLSMARSVLAEIHTVAAIRDALLPKLVSGQIRVPLSNDVDELIGEATEALA
jgi:type I restriction enzyme S subunit